jgi:hypothetical protein
MNLVFTKKIIFVLYAYDFCRDLATVKHGEGGRESRVSYLVVNSSQGAVSPRQPSSRPPPRLDIKARSASCADVTLANPFTPRMFTS